MKSILNAKDVPRQLNLNALQEYLALGYIPAPLSILDGIEKLMPGHYLVSEKGMVSTHEYWNVPCGHTEERSEEEGIDQIRKKLLETNRAQFARDFPWET